MRNIIGSATVTTVVACLVIQFEFAFIVTAAPVPQNNEASIDKRRETTNEILRLENNLKKSAGENKQFFPSKVDLSEELLQQPLQIDALDDEMAQKRFSKTKSVDGDSSSHADVRKETDATDKTSATRTDDQTNISQNDDHPSSFHEIHEVDSSDKTNQDENKGGEKSNSDSSSSNENTEENNMWQDADSSLTELKSQPNSEQEFDLQQLQEDYRDPSVQFGGDRNYYADLENSASRMSSDFSHDFSSQSNSKSSEKSAGELDHDDQQNNEYELQHQTAEEETNAIVVAKKGSKLTFADENIMM